MKKRFLGFVLVFSIFSAFITILPLSVSAAASGTCGDNLTWTLDDDYGTLTISGNGDMDDYGSYSYPW